MNALDQVRHIASVIRMTVIEIRGDVCVCEWTLNGHTKREEFLVRALVPYEMMR